ncbi:type II secretion system inner membrane protein GspF [Haliea sp.]|jgi:general secretion pathway protein F|uniref:type II secretion system inner membrane protein GspF n=1 Tax=Haliea TaxID=475794 RepID=UPI000C4452A2|nr:type II secretion system inner membrane protein GspF [Haliea sp.]HBM83401.1 type II secretion system protein GspF [Halieaceae bacterium]MAY92860.1 type II secretion system protein GspF [Haliea sp.]MBK40347.1 type II secretion system protein GspF [Haliea sp.]MBP68936.1 type II secretion system protein GspF [Haliea sp.]HCD54160.1 type II secretion system protein GspF [Halieaceae bacterium]|tara:strand:- start:55462 stop:56682 length:1221 start_codon:yes stop_codon:yes gene_type:complete
MTAYRYRALDASGKLVKGVLEGDSERQVRGQLRTQKLRPVDVAVANRQAESKPRSGWSFLQPRISVAELALVTRQLATLVQSNLPLDECLQAAAEQSRKGRTQGLLLQVRSRVAEGHTLAYAMGEFPLVFNEMYRAMVNAGEHAGFLGPVLAQLADYNEQRQYTAQKLKMAMIYPFILIAVALAVVVALMIFVVPELIGIFAHTNRELPLLTRGLIVASDFSRDYALWVLVAVVLLVFGLRRWLRQPQRRRRWHALLLRVPGFSRLVIAMDTARFASTLSILMASGVPLLESLRIAGQVLTNLVLREDSARVAERVQEGSSLHRALRENGRFPPMMVHMVASGEASGELETMLARSASNQERELEMTLGTLMSLLEPLLVVFMGGMVLVIVMAILLPIFDLNTMVR